MGGPEAEIRLATDGVAYLPGGAITATVQIIAKADLEEAECSVALFHVDRYRRSDSEGSSWTQDSEGAVAGEYVHQGPMRAGQVVEATAVLPVPRRIEPPEGPEDLVDERYPPAGDAADGDSYDVWIEPEERWGPPTSAGAGVGSEWFVRAEVGGAGFPDPAQVPVIVLAPATPAPDLPAARVGGGTPKAAISFFGLPRTSVRAGTALRGTVRVSAKEELKARGVRVELVRRASIDAGGSTSVTRMVATTVDVSGQVVLAARRPKDLAFAVDVPTDAGPSIVGEDYRIDWLLRAVVDRPLRRDEVWEQVIAVHTAP
ncbi:MAG: sporulation protein [Pseudonocardia sp.]